MTLIVIVVSKESNLTPPKLATVVQEQGQRWQETGGSPDKLPTHRAEGGLFEEGGRELMVLDDVDLGLLDGSTPSVQGHRPIHLLLLLLH